MTVDQKVNTIELSGNLNIRRSAEIQSLLLSEIREKRVVDLDCTNVTDVDLTFVQLIIAARKSADNSGVHITLTHPADGPLHAALRRAGLVGSSTHPTEADRIFWSCRVEEQADGQDDPHRR